MQYSSPEKKYNNSGIFAGLILVSVSFLILALALRGNWGAPNSTELNTIEWKDNGPLELSPERGRFALTYSIVEDNSVKFSLPVARLATPDLGYINGDYVSLFAPGVSYIITPGYVLGRALGASQVGAYAVVALFALFNVVLIRGISLKLGASNSASLLAGLTFIAATPAFAYGVSLYQHHISTFCILLAIYALLKWDNYKSLLLVWFLCTLSVSIDYPNFFMMLPIGIFAVGRIVKAKVVRESLHVNIKYLYILTFVSAILPVMFFFWFNQASYNNPLQFAGTVPSAWDIDAEGKPRLPETAVIGKDEDVFLLPEEQDKKVSNFFATRYLLNGFYLHFVSPDRGMLHFTPVMLLGFVGAFVFYKKNPRLCGLFLAILFSNILLYSMWGDPWGGWAFGSRYLVPTYAILSVFIAVLLTRFNKNFIVLILFLATFGYSSFVNTAGAITSNTNPPQVEVLALEKLSGRVQKYTYARNLDILNANESKSFVFRTFANKYMSAWDYFKIIYGLVMLTVSITWLVEVFNNYISLSFKDKKLIWKVKGKNA
ncbi:hypothetical protein KAZ57_00035 [Patescibacteria group bacterium]|nr:hypothetical protein [Patescibacteria group bacterium]